MSEMPQIDQEDLLREVGVFDLNYLAGYPQVRNETW